MLGDLRILAVGEDRRDGAPAELLLDTERSALQALFDMIRRFKVGYDVELHKRTLERGLLSLIGPRRPWRAPIAGRSGSSLSRAPGCRRPSTQSAGQIRRGRRSRRAPMWASI